MYLLVGGIVLMIILLSMCLCGKCKGQGYMVRGEQLPFSDCQKCSLISKEKFDSSDFCQSCQYIDN